MFAKLVPCLCHCDITNKDEGFEVRNNSGICEYYILTCTCRHMYIYIYT